VKDNAAGPGKTKTRGPGPSNADGKNDALTGKPQDKTRIPVERETSKNPTFVDKTPSGKTGVSETGKTPPVTRRQTLKPDDTDKAKTGPGVSRGKTGPTVEDSGIKGTPKSGVTETQPGAGSSRFKTPPPKTSPDAARGKPTGRELNADKTKKKTGNPDDDKDSDEKKR